MRQSRMTPTVTPPWNITCAAFNSKAPARMLRADRVDVRGRTAGVGAAFPVEAGRVRGAQRAGRRSRPVRARGDGHHHQGKNAVAAGDRQQPHGRRRQHRLQLHQDKHGDPHYVLGIGTGTLLAMAAQPDADLGLEDFTPLAFFGLDAQVVAVAADSKYHQRQTTDRSRQARTEHAIGRRHLGDRLRPAGAVPDGARPRREVQERDFQKRGGRRAGGGRRPRAADHREYQRDACRWSTAASCVCSR